MKYARRFLFDIPKKREWRAVDRTTHLIADERRCVRKSPDTLTHMKANYRRKLGHLTEFYKKRKTEVVIVKNSRTEFFSRTYQAPITRKRKAMGISYVLSEAIDLLDKDSSHEHHDLIVEKGDWEII